MLFTVVFFISGIFQIYEVYLCYQCFFRSEKVPRFYEVVCYIGLFMVTTLPYLYVGKPVITMLFSYVGCVLTTFLYAGNIKKKILIGTLAFSIMALSECTVAVFAGYINLDIFAKQGYQSTFGTVCLPLVQYVIILFVRNLKNVKNGENVPTMYWVMSVALPIMSVSLFTMLYNQPYIKTVELITSVVVLFILNIFVFALYDRQLEAFQISKEKDTLELQNKYQLNQLELMNQVVDYSRQQNHDFIKHISMISFLNKQKKTKQLEAYLEELHANAKSHQSFVSTGNYIIDSVLNYKIQEALAIGIKINVVAKVPSDITFSIYDMNVVLTNLLDNSIEAVQKTSDKWVEVRISYLSGRLLIKTKNPCDSIRKDEQGRLISSKTNTRFHGYGLRNVETIVEKYNGIFDFYQREECFFVTVCLFL